MIEPEKIAAHVAGRMKARRLEMGLNQEQAAASMGWKTKTYFNRETGLRGMSVEDLYAAARALNVTPNYFYEGI